MLTYPWHRAEIMRNTPDFTPKSAQNTHKQKITVADIVSTTVTDLANLPLVDTMHYDFDAWCIFCACQSVPLVQRGQKGQRKVYNAGFA